MTVSVRKFSFRRGSCRAQSGRTLPVHAQSVLITARISKMKLDWRDAGICGSPEDSDCVEGQLVSLRVGRVSTTTASIIPGIPVLPF